MRAWWARILTAGIRWSAGRGLQERPPDATALAQPPASMAPVRTLIVDDHADVRFLIRAIIADADGGRGGRRRRPTGSRRRWPSSTRLAPDAVVLDARMPRVDGFEAAPLLHARRPGMTLVLCTGLVDDDVRRRADAGGLRRRGFQGRVRRPARHRGAGGAVAPAERRGAIAVARPPCAGRLGGCRDIPLWNGGQRPITRPWPHHGPRAGHAAPAARAGRPARAGAPRLHRAVRHGLRPERRSSTNLIYDGLLVRLGGAVPRARRTCTASSAAPGSSWASAMLAYACRQRALVARLHRQRRRRPTPRSPTRFWLAFYPAGLRGDAELLRARACRTSTRACGSTA